MTHTKSQTREKKNGTESQKPKTQNEKEIKKRMKRKATTCGTVRTKG